MRLLKRFLILSLVLPSLSVFADSSTKQPTSTVLKCSVKNVENGTIVNLSTNPAAQDYPSRRQFAQIGSYVFEVMEANNMERPEVNNGDETITLNHNSGATETKTGVVRVYNKFLKDEQGNHIFMLDKKITTTKENSNSISINESVAIDETTFAITCESVPE